MIATDKWCDEKYKTILASYIFMVIICLVWLN